jgi:hypothetical protein
VIAARLAAAFASLAAPSAAEPLTADLLPPDLLSACEADADPSGRYAPPIAASVRALADIGVFAAKEFDGVRIGFCALQAAGGPVATASCADGVILLDEKYARPGESLTLQATLAHEMKHHFQHEDRKARFGQAYCDSARYVADKPALEAEADAFGDAVGELFVRGRAVEIVNACDAPVSIYLEADDPVAVRGAEPRFQQIAAKSSAPAAERAMSGTVRFHARTTAAARPAFVWQDRTSPHSRIVEGRSIRLTERRLSAMGREQGPFRLRLSCPGERR